jgi:regulator of sirC expression with transglutaminase-like and TPR domain
MNPVLPICCDTRAYRSLSDELGSLETPGGLVRAAVAIARHQMCTVDLGEVEGTIARYASTVARRVRGPQTQAILAHLHQLLFEEEKFTGNTQDYYNPMNSYLPHVLTSRIGLPITLCLVYKAVADRLGLNVWGMGMPGHFLAAVNADRRAMWIDPFAGGRVVTLEEVRHRMVSQFGKDLEWSDQFLSPVNHRYWITRLLQNLISAFGREGHYSDVAAVLEMEMVLWPEEARLQRDLALVLARIGMGESASMWLDLYLQNNPADPNRGELKQLLTSLAT